MDQMKMFAVPPAVARDANYRVIDPEEKFVTKMRWVAREIALERGQVTADDLRVWADEQKIKPREKNWWGTVFNTNEVPQLREIGRMRSTWPSNHGRNIAVWKWVE